MDRSNDYEVIKAALAWLDAAEPVFLVTVAKRWGASPRYPGSLMAIHPDGGFVGSVSGGCVEDDLVQRVMRGDFESGLPSLQTYGIGGAQAQRVGLPRGGSLTLLLERIDVPDQLRLLLSRMEAQQPINRRVCLDTGEVSLQAASEERGLLFDGLNLFKTFGATWRLLRVGTGELSRRLAQIAMTLDDGVSLCDPRPEEALQQAPWLPEAVHSIPERPFQAIKAFGADRRTSIPALPHTPILDDEAVIAALGSEAGYIGTLGSQKNQQARRERLLRQGLTAAQLDPVDGPVGLSIGSRTPAEIAVSIAADLIQAHRTQSREISLETAYA